VTALGSLATALARNVNIYSVVSVRLVVRLSVCPSVSALASIPTFEPPDL